MRASDRTVARSRTKTGIPGRLLRVKLKTAKGRTVSSARWLERQLGDPYVAAARAQGYRSRAAFKLIELDDRFHILKPGARVVDLGAAPGSWSQVALDRVKAGKPGGGGVIAVDAEEIEPVSGATILRQDLLAGDALAVLAEALGGPVDVVLSDMAPPATGHRPTDHLRVMTLAAAAFEFACEVLCPGGTFVVKVLQGGTERELLTAMKQRFRVVRHAKPRASRPESAEAYVVACGYRGREHNRQPEKV